MAVQPCMEWTPIKKKKSIAYGKGNGHNTGAEIFVQSIKLLVGMTRNDGEQILERPIHKIVLLTESEIWFPDGDAKC